MPGSGIVSLKARPLADISASSVLVGGFSACDSALRAQLTNANTQQMNTLLITIPPVQKPVLFGGNYNIMLIIKYWNLRETSKANLC
jgi:hypothetical protein